MSIIAPHPNNHNDNDSDSAPIYISPFDQNSLTKLVKKPINADKPQQLVSPTQSSVTTVLIKGISKPYFAFSAIVGFGLILFITGVVFILIYFSSHPILIKSNEVESFELKRVLTDESEIAQSNTSQTVKPSTLNALPHTGSNAISLKNKALDDYIPSIQPKIFPPNVVVQVSPPAQDVNNDIPKSKKESILPPQKMATHPNVNTHEIQPKNKTNDEKTKEEKNDISLIKPPNNTKEYVIDEPLCDQAMRSLNQCH